MKPSSLILSALIMAASSQAATFKLQTTSAEPLYQTSLPKTVYQYSRSNQLEDLTITNADGETVPYALAPYTNIHPQTVVTEKSQAMVIFPLQEDLLATAGIASIQLNNKDSSTSIQVTSPSTDSKQKTYYLFDLGQQHQPFKKITLDWEGQAGKLLSLDVLTSDNLKDWQSVGEATLLKVVANDDTILKNSASFVRPVTARYLQIRPQQNEDTFVLKSTSLQFDEVEAVTLPIDWQTIPFLKRAETDQSVHIEYESPSRYPATYLMTKLPQQNTITSVTVAVRNHENEPWRAIKSTPLYNFSKDSKRYTHNPIQIPVTTARYWRLSFSKQSGGIGGKNPEFSLGWLPDTLIWNARGSGPYQLQVGETTKLTGATHVNELLRPYGSQKLSELPSARIDLIAASPNTQAWEKPKDHKRLWLWGGLFLGVIALAYMAYSLLKATQKQP